MGDGTSGKWSYPWLQLQHTHETHLASQQIVKLCSYILAVPKWFDRNCCWQKRFRFAPAAPPLAPPLAQVGTTWSHRYVVRRSLAPVCGGDNERQRRSTLLPPSPSFAVAELNALFHGQTNFRLQRRCVAESGTTRHAVLCKIEPVLPLPPLRTSQGRHNHPRTQNES